MAQIEVIFNKDKREATIRMYGVIGSDVNGNEMAHELSSLDTDTDTIHLLINSNGGDVSQGLSIVSAILSAKAFVHAHINGIAASMAAVIAISADKVSMQDYAKLMIHDPYFVGKGTERMSDRDKKCLANVTDTLRTILSRRGCQKDKVAKLMSDETWFSADEAKAAGLVDEVVSTPRKQELGSLAAPELLNLIFLEDQHKKQFVKMKEIAKSLGLPETATEQQIIDAINNRTKSAATREQSIVERMIAIGEQHGTVNERNKERMSRLALADFELFLDMVTDFDSTTKADGENEETLVAKPDESKRLSDVLSRKQAVKGSQGGNAQAKHDWAWYQEHDPNALLAMEREQPELFKRLLDEYEQSL